MIIDLKSIKNEDDFWDWVDIRKSYDLGYFDDAITRAIKKMEPYIKKRKFIVESTIKNVDEAEDFEQSCFIAIMENFKKWKPFKYTLFDGSIVFDSKLEQKDDAEYVQGRLGYAFFKVVIDRRECDLYRELKSRHDVLSTNGEVMSMNNTYKINGKKLIETSDVDLDVTLLRQELIDEWNKLTNVLEDEKEQKGIKRANYDKRRRMMNKFIENKEVKYADVL